MYPQNIPEVIPFCDQNCSHVGNGNVPEWNHNLSHMLYMPYILNMLYMLHMQHMLYIIHMLHMQHMQHTLYMLHMQHILHMQHMPHMLHMQHMLIGNETDGWWVDPPTISFISPQMKLLV